MLVTATIVGEQAMTDWGWRIPFLMAVRFAGFAIAHNVSTASAPV